jgi:hypothetical protein
MSKRNYLGYISLPLRAVIVLFLIMFIVLFAQFVITQLIWLYTYEMPSPTQISDDIESRINRAEKLYLPDGTMHLVHRMNEKGTCDYTKEEITDADGNVFWRGNRDERPFKYLEWSEPLNRGHEFFDARSI